jgi:hypothetical protein
LPGDIRCRRLPQLFFQAHGYAPGIGLYSISTAHSPVSLRMTAMGKEKSSKKEAKKQPALSPKEKKAVKQAKKHASDHIPLVTR